MNDLVLDLASLLLLLLLEIPKIAIANDDWDDHIECYSYTNSIDEHHPHFLLLIRTFLSSRNINIFKLLHELAILLCLSPEILLQFCYFLFHLPMLPIFLLKTILGLILILMLPKVLFYFSDVLQSLRHIVHIKNMELMDLGEDVDFF